MMQVKPEEIERRSFEIIKSEITQEISPELEPIVYRVIHTTADFSFAENLAFSTDVVEKAHTAIKNGTSIITDTNMGRAGINKKRLESFGGKVHCFIADDDVADKAKKDGTTRAVASMEKAAELGEDFIYAIGNAPTALIQLCQQIEQGRIKPKLIIGVPVGFVNVVESKEMLLKLDVPYIVAKGRKGGSNVAAAICNALIYNA